MIIPHSRPMIDAEDTKIVSDVLASGMIAQGKSVMKFEAKIAEYVGVKYAVAVSSGTSAIHVALTSIGVGKGDEVIMPSYVCSSPYMATLHAGAIPKIVDIDRSDYNISIHATRENITNKTGAVIVPHMFGTPADLDDFLELGVPIIEDCAQALGAEYRGKKVGSLGLASIFSFYATKMITTGEGGMVLTDDPEVYRLAKEIREYDGRSLDVVRYNYKMTDIGAALGMSQLKKLGYFIEKRRLIAAKYSEILENNSSNILRIDPNKKSVFYRFILLTEKLELMRNFMRENGIICERPVSSPLHRGLPSLICPNAEYVFGRAISVPLFPSMSDEEINRVSQSLEFAIRQL
jgi:perosamine synthetase